MPNTLLAPETVAHPVQVEIVEGFDFNSVPEGLRDELREDTNVIRDEIKSTALSMYRIGEIIDKWHKRYQEGPKERFSKFSEWLNFCCDKSRSYAYLCQQVFIRFNGRNVQLLDKFNSKSLQELCHSNVSPEIFDAAIALAEKGQAVTKDRAQLLKKGIEVMTVAKGDEVTIRNRQSPYFNAEKPVVGTVYATNPKHGQLDIQTPEGDILTVTIWELNPPAPLPPPKDPKAPEVPPAPLVQSIDMIRLAGVEEVLQRLIAASLASAPLLPVGPERTELELAIATANEFF